MDNPILQRRQLISKNAIAQFSKGEDIEIIDESQLNGLVTFDERAVNQLVNDLQKAEATGYFSGHKVTKDEIKKAKEQAEKLEKKVVKDKSGGTKTVYVKVVDQTKPHHKMSHEELLEHHTSQELHQIADNYKVNHDNIKTSVEKNGAADDPYKSQKATNKRSDVASSEEAYMHIKQAAYKKEKIEGKSAKDAVKGANKGYDPTAKKDEVKKAFQCDILEKGGSNPELTRKQIIDKNGHSKTVYVRNWDTEEHHFAVGHKVHFQHKDGTQGEGDITGMKYHAKYDKFGTATIRDKEGNEHSRSLKNVENHKDNDFKYDTSKEDTPIDKKTVEASSKIKEDEKPVPKGGDSVKDADTDSDGAKTKGSGEKKKPVVYDNFKDLTVAQHKEKSDYHHTEMKAANDTAQLYSEDADKSAYFKNIADEHKKEMNKHSDAAAEKSAAKNSPKTDEKPKLLTGAEAINKKNKDLKAVEEQLKNHDSGVKTLSNEEVTALKEKKQIITKTIKQLESKLNLEKALNFLMGNDTFEK